MRFVPIEQEDAPQLTFVPIESAEPPVPQKTGGRAWGDTAGDAWQSLRSGIGSVVNMAGTAADDPLAFFGATGTAIADTLATGPVRAASTLKEWATGDGSLPLDMDKGARELHGGFSPAYEKYGSDLASSRKAADESGSVSSVLRGVGGLIQEQSKEKMSASSKARDARYEKTKGFEALSFLKDEPGKIIDMIAENIPQQLPMLGLGRGAGIIANRAAVREAQIAGAGAFEYATTQPGVRAALEAGSQGMDNWVKSSVEKAAKEAAEKAMERFSPYMTAINVGSESLSTVAQTVDAIHKGVANAKLEDLMQIPMYRDFLAQSNGNDSDARRLLAARLSAEWAPVSGIGTAFGSLVTGGAKAQAQALAGQVTGFKLASKNTGKEALEEMVQNPLEDAGMFWAKKQYDPTAELDPVKSAIEGAVVSVGHSGPLQFAKPIADSVKRSPEEQIARDIDYGVKNTSYDSSLVDAEARNKLSANQGLDPTLYAKPRPSPADVVAPDVSSVEEAIARAQAVVNSAGAQWQALGITNPQVDLSAQKQAAQSGSITQAANNYQAILAAQQAGRQWRDIRPIGDPSSASSEIDRSAPPIESTGMPTSATPSGRSQRSQNASQPNQPQALVNTDVAATNTVAPAAPTNPIAQTSDVELLSRVPEIGEMQASTTMPQFSYTVQPNGAVMIHGDTASIKEAFPGERTYSVKGGVLVGATRAADVVSALGGDYETATVRNSDAGTSQGSGNAADTNAGAIPEMARREGQAIPQSVQQADSDASRAAGQETLDYFHSKDPATHPKVVLGRPDAKADAQIQSAMQQAKELFGTTANVVAFSDPSPDSVNGIQIGKTVYINTKGLTSNALNTGWHETHHVMQAQAEADTREGKINTTAQRYISKVDAIFDSMSEAGKRSYIENFLYKDRLAGLSRQEREAAVQSALTSAETRKEMMADFVGNRATDREFIKSLAKADPKNFQQWAKKWLQTITDLIADLRGKKSSKSESDAVDKYVRDLNKAKMILRDAMVELRREGVISQSDNAGIDYSRKGVIGEVAPNPDKPVAKEWDAMDGGEKSQANRNVAQKLFRSLMDLNGLRDWSIEYSTGQYQGKTNPNFIIDAPENATQQQMNDVAREMGYILDQQSMVVFDEGNTSGGNQNSFVKVVLPDGFPSSKLQELRDLIRDKFPRADANTQTKPNELVFGNFTAFNGNVPLSDTDFRAGIISSIEALDWEGAALEIPPTERYESELIWPDNRADYLKEGEYGKSNRTSLEPGGDNVRSEKRDRLVQLRKLARDSLGKRKDWIDSSTSGRERIKRNREVLAEQAARNAGAGEREYGTAGKYSVQAVGQHYSKEQRTSLSSGFYGTGLKGAESQRLSGPQNADLRQRVYFYVDSGAGVTPESGVGGIKHSVKLNNLYDTKTDPLGIIKNTKGDGSQSRINLWERAIRDAGFDGYLADTGANQNFAVLVGKHDIPMYKRRESYDSIDDINDLGNFNLDDIGVSESDDEKLFKKFDPDAIDAGELAAKIEAELMEKMYGTTTGKVADSGALKTSDFGATLDRSIKQAGLHPENAFPDLEYKTNSDGSRTAAFRVNGVRYISEIKDGKSPSMRGPSGLDADPGDSNANGNLGGHAISHDFRGLTQEAKEAWNKRMAANGELLRRGYDIYTAVPKDARQRVADVWKSIAQNPDAFEFMKAESPTGKNYKEVALDIAKKMLGSGRYEARLGELDDSENMTHSGGFALFIKDKKTGIESRATVDYNRLEKRVVMHTHNLEKGSGAGKAVYQVGQAFATAFNAKIKADHVLLGVNNYRRTEQMFSGMLRSGNYDTMQPGIGQRIFGWNERAKTADQQERNMVRTALAITRNVEELAPDISKISYDLQSGRFYMKDRGDTTESRLMAGIIVKRILADTDVRAMSVSRSTLARAAVTLDAIEGNVEVPDHIHEPVLYSRKQRKLDERTDVAPMMDELGRALKSKTSASIDRAMGRISDWRKMLNSVNEASFQSELMGIGERAVSLAVRSGVTEQDARTVPVPTGATPHVLRMLGFDMNPMTASSRIIGKILNGKHAKDFANATPKEFIESIYHPILITNLQKPDEYEIVSNIIHPQDGSPESGFPVVFVVKRNAVFEGQVGENGKRMKSLATHSLMSAYAKPSFWTIGLRSGMKTGKLLYANVGALQELESKNPALGRVLLPRGASTNPDTQTVNPVSADSASLPSTSDDGSLRKERANVSIGSAPSGLVAPSASQLTKDIAKSVMAGSVKGYGDLVKWVSENYTGDGDEMPLYSRKHYDSQAALDAKFERMRRFHQDFDDLRQRIHDDAENGKEEAAILRLIARTGFRIGGDPSLSGNHEAFGASTLKPDHVTIDGDEIHFDFIGKAGVRQQHSIEDPVLAKDLAARLENEKLFSKADRAVRKYLDSIIDGKDYKVHDFRTWNATRAAMDVVNDLPLPVNAEEFRAAMELAGSVAASKIGDTLGVTLEHYVDPQIFDEWRESAGVKNPPRVPSSTGQSESQSTEADDAGAGEGDNGQAVQVDLSRKQTDTPEFKKWFGDSKVVDADGKPLVLYHGTKGDFTKFGKTRTGVGSTMFGTYEVERHGIFVTPSAELANDFATQGERNKQTGANVMPLYASIQDPLDMTQGYTDSIFNAVEKWGDAKDLNGYRIARNLGDSWGDWMLFDEDTGQDPGFLINMLKELGYDGVKFYEPKVAGEGASGDTFVAFDPEQIKSAIGNNGDFDGTNPDIRYKRKEIVGQTNRQYTPEQLRAFSNVGFQVEVPTLAERAKEMWKDAGKRLTQGIADQFVPIAEFDKKAYGLMRLSKGASGAFEALLQGGKLKLTDKVYDFDANNRGGVVETLLTPLQGEHHDFLRWIAANRAERLSAEDRENLFSAEDIVAIKSLASGQTDFDYTLKHGPNAGSVTRNRSEIYNDSLKTFDAFNRNVMDMAEQSGLIDPEARAVWEHEFYVPFYRQTDEDGFVGARVKAGVVRQKAFKELKGGKDKLNADLLDNTLMNWAHLLDASAKNRAAAATLEAAEDLGIAIEAPESTLRNMSKSIGNKNGVVWVMDEGKQRFFLVDDPYVLAALNGLEYAGMKGPIMDVMSSFKHALTIGVTASPFFKVRNLIRDSVQAISVGNLSYNPVKNVVQGFKLSNRGSDDHFRLLASGGTIHFGTMYEGSEARRVQALVESGVDQGSILDSQHKVKAFYRKFIEPGITAYNELGNRGEEINRASLYDQLRKQGVSHADAALQARDLMDFSMQGSFQTVRFLTQVVPFMNARIQGLYKLGKGAKENPARFSAVLGMVAVASLGLLAAYHDDDEWKKREEFDRNNFWWFKFGGQAFRIPKPFEIGAIATLAERGFEWMFDKEMTNKRFMSQVGTLLSDNLSMNPIPQAVKPILDVYSNKDSFSGRDIQSASMEKLEPQERYNAGTSMAARGASTAMSKVMGTSALSPVQIDHLLRGYFGWLGSFVVGAGDVIARPATNQPKRPTPDYWKVATGGMVADKDSGSSRYVSQMYEQAKELEMAYSTFRAIEKKGNAEATREYVKDNRDKLQRYGQVEAAKKSLSLMNERIRMIERSSMEPDKKRDMIRDLKDKEDRIARSLVPH